MERIDIKLTLSCEM